MPVLHFNLKGELTMFKKVCVIGVSVIFAVGVWADYPADRKSAVELARAGKKEQALEAF